jgi:hypothetical protein
VVKALLCIISIRISTKHRNDGTSKQVQPMSDKLNILIQCEREVKNSHLSQANKQMIFIEILHAKLRISDRGEKSKANDESGNEQDFIDLYCDIKRLCRRFH